MQGRLPGAPSGPMLSEQWKFRLGNEFGGDKVGRRHVAAMVRATWPSGERRARRQP
jgi:hypothetical protein